jgi:hypothetical protein
MRSGQKQMAASAAKKTRLKVEGNRVFMATLTGTLVQ